MLNQDSNQQNAESQHAAVHSQHTAVMAWPSWPSWPRVVVAALLLTFMFPSAATCALVACVLWLYLVDCLRPVLTRVVAWWVLPPASRHLMDDDLIDEDSYTDALYEVFPVQEFYTEGIAQPYLQGGDFRTESFKVLKKYDLGFTQAGVTGGKDAGRKRQLCHRVPNYILSKTYNAADSVRLKQQLLVFGFSSDNVFRGANNSKHTKMEQNFKFDRATYADKTAKGEMLMTGLTNLLNDEHSRYLDPDAVCAAILETFINESFLYCEVVDALDKRSFNGDKTKLQIERATGKVNATVGRQRMAKSPKTPRTTAASWRRATRSPAPRPAARR